MSIPQWTLLGFTAWTLGLLMATVGVYRWGNILFAKAAIASFRHDAPEGAGWYQRGTRAHANCIENLPVFGAIVYIITGVKHPHFGKLLTSMTTPAQMQRIQAALAPIMKDA